MTTRKNQMEDSSDRPAASYVLFGLGALSSLIAGGGVIVGSPWIVALGFLSVLVSAGFFWLGALFTEE